MKDTIKKYTGIKAYQDYIEEVEVAEKKGTGLLEDIKFPTDEELRDYMSTDNGAYEGKTFQEASKGVKIFTSKKQGCCECVIYSYENIMRKFWLNRGYIPKENIIDTTLNYSLFNVKENAMVGCVPASVYNEFNKNGAVPKMTEKDNISDRWKNWYIQRSNSFTQLAKDVRITFLGEKVSEHKGFFSFGIFQEELTKAQNKYGKEKVMFRISKQSASGVKWYNTDIPYIDKSVRFKYYNGGHSMAGDGEIGIYETEKERSVYIYESYGATRFHHLKASVFDLVVKSWEIYVDDIGQKVKEAENIFNEELDKFKPQYKRVSKRCYKGKPCRNIKTQVMIIQKKLGLIVDGNFGIQTERAIKHFQKLNDLKVDGVVGKITWNKLFMI